MKVFLVRHGETEWNVKQKIQGITDVKLNSNGKIQAENFYEKFSTEHKIDIIYSSPLKRALETAQIYAEKNNIPLYIEQDLTEMNLGIFEGISWDEVKMKYKEEYAIWRKNIQENRIPKGESYLEVALRCNRVIQKIKKENCDDKQILLFSHSATIKAFMCFLNHTSYYEMNQYYSIKNLGYHEIEL